MLDTLSISDQEKELKDSKTFINQQLSLPGVDCNTFAYPYCHLSDSAITGKYYIAARVCTQEIVPSTPPDYCQIPSIVCGDQGSIRSMDDFRQSLEYLDNHRETYWVTTFRDAVRYAKERDAASVTEKQRTKSAITLLLTDTLDDTVYNLPLTIRRPLPEGWESVVVKQDGSPVPSDVVMISQKRSIIFEAVPDKGIVSIERQ
ncbi:hypothetical protein FACS1894182_02120 [Bacteroidia bacterium]|nr:hypothetical protein FACS1894182_02120 [Bacteroidia bacterium]